MPEDLPSVRFQPGDARPLGFVTEVSEAHLRAVGKFFVELADTVNDVADDAGAAIHVRLTSVRHTAVLPFVLYGFHIPRVDDTGEFVDEVLSGEEITYAVIANHAIEVQREAALLFLYELVFRQEALASLGRQNAPIAGSVDTVATVADQQARQEFRDRLYSGWFATAQSIARRAAASGLTLAVRYEVDPITTREEIARRVPVLRRTYNEISTVHEAVDNIVSALSGQDPVVSSVSISQAELNRASRRVASMNLRQWLSQTARDAQVCGNGYLVLAPPARRGFYNLRPEDVEVSGADQYRVLRNGISSAVADRVLHLRGIEQFESPYGISLLEPILAEYRTRRLFAQASDFAQDVLARRAFDTPEGQWARQVVALSKRSLGASDDRLGRLLWFPQGRLRPARSDLYFPGQDYM